MTDFLTALAAAALGMSDGVEPRPRSRFEEAPAMPWGEETVEIEAPAVREGEEPHAPAAAVRRARLPEPGGEQPAPEAAPFIETPAPAPAPEPTAQHATAISHVRVAEMPPAPPTQPQPAPVDAPRRSDAVMEREAARPAAPARILGINDAATARDAMPPTAPPPAIAAREPPAPIVIVPEVAEPARAEALGRERARADVTAAPPAEPQAPVIAVTIGRIEVRAVPPPAAPLQPPQPAAKFVPALSLADYLTRRNRGGA